jgi:hypothetical protein
MSDQDLKSSENDEREEMIRDFIRLMESIDAAREAAGDELEAEEPPQVVQ